jgi:hypothetical protein
MATNYTQPGPNEFTAEQEKAMREGQMAANSSMLLQSINKKSGKITTQDLKPVEIPQSDF